MTTDKIEDTSTPIEEEVTEDEVIVDEETVDEDFTVEKETVEHITRGNQTLRVVDVLVVDGERDLSSYLEGIIYLGYSVEVKILGTSSTKVYQQYEVTLLKPIK